MLAKRHFPGAASRYFLAQMLNRAWARFNSGKNRKPDRERKSRIPGVPEIIFAESADDPRLPLPGSIEPPFLKPRPGNLSFKLGPFHLRQLVYDGDRNRNEPIVLRPGALSFGLGPLKFRQISTDRFNVGCCAHRDANCWILAGCLQDDAF